MSEEPKPKKRRRWLYIIGGLVLLCVCGLVAVLLFVPSAEEATEPPIAQATQASEDEPADEPADPTDTPQPTETAVPTDTPQPTNTPPPDGRSRESAAPFGNEVEISDMLIKIAEVERPADETIAEGNMFNGDPEPGNEFILVTVAGTCTKESSQTCLISPSSFQLSGSAGIVRNTLFGITGVPGELDQTEFFGGATISGWIAFEVGQDETGLILSYEPLFSLSTAHFVVEE